MKIKCKCGKLATWSYMPGERNCCDDCVPRGCSCWNNPISFEDNNDIIDNYPEGIEGKDWKRIKKDRFWQELDGEGKELPCIEWWYDKEGWDDED